MAFLVTLFVAGVLPIWFPSLFLLRFGGVFLSGVVRFGVSLEPKLLKKFDVLIKKKGYSTRSEAIRDMLRTALTETEIESDTEIRVVGAISIVYDHHAANVTQRLLDLQHLHLPEVIATTHVHIDRRNCLETIIVRGRAREVRNLSDNIKAIKGVEQGKLFLTKASF